MRRALKKPASLITKAALIAALASCSPPPSTRLPLGIVFPEGATGTAQLQLLFARLPTVTCDAYLTASAPGSSIAAPAGCYATAGLPLGALQQVEGPDGNRHRAYRIAFVSAPNVATTFDVGEVPSGKSYAVIVETTDASGNLTYRGCQQTGAVRTGTNDAIQVTLQAWSGAACQPAISG